jgi:polygalacturonase
VKKISTYFFCLVFLSCHKEEVIETITLLPLQQGVNVMEQGARADGISDDSPAFEKAMQIANLQKLPVVVPAGKYRADILITFDGIQLVGQGQPDWHFSQGTIIIGTINCNNKKNVEIRNVGIDGRNIKTAAALTSGDGEDSIELHQKFTHLSLIGSGYHAYNHGILCQTGRKIFISNVLVKNFYHGIAIRSGGVVVDSVEAISCGFTSIIIKSAENKNRLTRDVTIKNVNVSGNAHNPFERGGTIMVQSYEDNSITENIYIGKVKSKDAGVSAIAIDESKGKVRNVLIEDCYAVNQGDVSERACFDIRGGSNITLKNCSSSQARGTGFRCSGATEKVRAEQCYESGSGVRPWWGSFSYLQLNGQEIIK